MSELKKKPSKNITSFILDLSFITVEELAFSEYFKKEGCFCSVEANPGLF